MRLRLFDRPRVVDDFALPAAHLRRTPIRTRAVGARKWPRYSSPSGLVDVGRVLSDHTVGAILAASWASSVQRASSRSCKRWAQADLWAPLPGCLGSSRIMRSNRSHQGARDHGKNRGGRKAPRTSRTAISSWASSCDRAEPTTRAHARAGGHARHGRRLDLEARVTSGRPPRRRESPRHVARPVSGDRAPRWTRRRSPLARASRPTCDPTVASNGSRRGACSSPRCPDAAVAIMSDRDEQEMRLRVQATSATSSPGAAATAQRVSWPPRCRGVPRDPQHPPDVATSTCHRSSRDRAPSARALGRGRPVGSGKSSTLPRSSSCSRIERGTSSTLEDPSFRANPTKSR